jgi:hypothetical protein
MKVEKMTTNMSDVEATKSGYLRIACDGTHDFLYHFYSDYTRAHALRLWKLEHPQKQAQR